MTKSLPTRDRRPVAASATQNGISAARKILLAIGTLLICWFLLNSSLLAQSAEDSDEKVTTSAEQSAEESEKDQGFDFFGNKTPISVEQLKEMEEHFLKLSKEVADATVNIQVGQSQGSGVIVTRDGYVMTAAHVISGSGLDAKITLADGKTVLDAKTLGLNRTVDSGLLKIEDKDMKKFPYLNPGVSEDLKVGQWVMSIGHPGGLDPDRGLVYRIGRIVRMSDTFMVSDCSLVGGDSGGPLVDMDGSVIGIHSRIGNNVATNIHVPVDIYSDEWDRLAKGEDWGRGIGGSNPANEPWLGLSFEEDKPLQIRSVVPDGPADKAGIKKGDVLLKIGDRKITRRSTLRGQFNRMKPKDKIKIQVKRGDKELTLDLTVGSQADNR